MEKINKISEILNKYFNEKAEEKAREEGFIKRNRKISGSSFLKGMVLGNLEDGRSSIENICQILYQDEIEITKQGLEFRFTEEAKEYMRSMWIEGFESLKNTMKIECEILEKFKGVKILDSSYPSTIDGRSI